MTQQQQYQQPPPQQPPPQYQQPPPPQYGPPPNRFHMHADIVHRFVALLIDAIILFIINLVIVFVIGAFIALGFGMYTIWGALIFGAIWFLLCLLYFAIQESGPSQATIGKKVMHLKVVNMNYQQIDMGTAIVRNIFKALWGMTFWLLLLVDIILVITRDDKQSIGDIVAHTYVIEDRAMGPQPYYPPPPQQPYQQQQAPPPQQQAPPPGH